jgi:hypothetical protein
MRDDQVMFGKHLSHATQECFVVQREKMELLAARATLWRMEIEILREIHLISSLLPSVQLSNNHCNASCLIFAEQLRR